MTPTPQFVSKGGNQIHTSAVMGASVRLGTGNIIGPGSVLAGRLVVGDGNFFGANVVVGCPPEVRGFPHTADWIDTSEGEGVVIGNRCVFREGAQVHTGWHDQTVVGDEVFLMNQVYVAHDCHLADGVTMASNVAVGGHVHVGLHANLGLGTVVHQRRSIGALAMVGMGSVVTRDVPPFAKAFGNPCRVKGTNSVGMERMGISAESIREVQEALERGELPGDMGYGDLAPYATTR
ncbi:MAG: hypothetical protein ACYC1E_13505 [Propionibacteriaceae bacterium]